MEGLLTQHHVKVPVAVRQDALTFQPRGCPLLGIIRYPNEIDEGRQHRHRVLAGLQESRHHYGLIDPKQAGTLEHGRRGLLTAPCGSTEEALPICKLRVRMSDCWR